jgi:ABC-type amino acid transport substrate-binding protein
MCSSRLVFVVRPRRGKNFFVTSEGGVMGVRCRLPFIVTFVLVFFAVSAKAEVRFGIAAEPYPPFAWKDATGQWVGWELDLMNAVQPVQGEM